MTDGAPLAGQARGPAIAIIAALALAVSVAASWFAERALLEAWLYGFVTLAGISIGALGLLMIGHLMGEDWLSPVRREIEAAALVSPLLAVLALPVAVNLSDLYPWAGAVPPELPGARATFLAPGFFLARGAAYLTIWTALALWLVRTPNVRVASGIGLALLAPTAVYAAIDWSLSRDPLFWSSLYGFAFAASQLLAALAFVIMAALLHRHRPESANVSSLERAMLTLALLAAWAWFSQFLIVWLANLPAEAAWYLDRTENWLWALTLVAGPALVVAILILVPPGASRGIILAGAGLVLVHHAAHMLWLVRPAKGAPPANLLDAVVPLVLALIYGAAFGAALQLRPARRDAFVKNPESRARATARG